MPKVICPLEEQEDVGEEEEDVGCADLCPLFEYRLVSHADSSVTLDFGLPGLRVELRQELEMRCAADPSAPACCPTELTRRTGAVVWDAAVVLASLLALSGREEDSALLIGPWETLLELGAGGHGLCGLVALLAGACQSAAFTDRPPLLDQLQENLERNLAGKIGRDRWTVQPLLWGEEGNRVGAVARELIVCGDGAATLESDVEASSMPEFDLVVAADCVYDVDSAEALAITISEALPMGSVGEALVAFDRALDREGAYERFLTRCASLGLPPHAWPQALGPYRKDSVSIYRLYR